MYKFISLTFSLLYILPHPHRALSPAEMVYCKLFKSNLVSVLGLTSDSFYFPTTPCKNTLFLFFRMLQNNKEKKF